VLTVLAQPALWKTKIKSLLSYFHGLVILHTVFPPFAANQALLAGYQRLTLASSLWLAVAG
jgi:hypothetical protein